MIKERFSALELKHLGISVLAMSFVIAYQGDLLLTLYQVPFALVVIAPAFVLHELGHKFAAQKYGFAAEYRMWTRGLFFAFVLKVFLGFTFIAPGAVYFSARSQGHYSKEKIGKIGLAGPLVNLCLVVVFGLVGFLSVSPILQMIGFMGGYVNAFLAFFNCLPIAPFDGQKIMTWDKRIWLLVIGLAAVCWFLFMSAL